MSFKCSDIVYREIDAVRGEFLKRVILSVYQEEGKMPVYTLYDLATSQKLSGVYYDNNLLDPEQVKKFVRAFLNGELRGLTVNPEKKEEEISDVREQLSIL